MQSFLVLSKNRYEKDGVIRAVVIVAQHSKTENFEGFQTLSIVADPNVFGQITHVPALYDCQVDMEIGQSWNKEARMMVSAPRPIIKGAKLTAYLEQRPVTAQAPQPAKAG